MTKIAPPTEFYAMHDGDYDYVVACDAPSDWENSPRIGYRFKTEAERDEFITRRNEAARKEYSI